MIIEITTLAVYFIVLLLLGTLFSRFNRNLSDFVRGGAKGTWWLVGTSITMAGISAFTFTGNGSAAFDAGPSLLIIYVANILGFACGGLFLARWYRQTRAMTGADVIRGCFGTVVEQYAVYVGVLLGPIGAAIQLWALGIFVSSVFGLPLHLTIIAVGLIVLIYSVSGGAWAVMATDVVQCTILFMVTVLVAVLSIVEIGGVSSFLSYFSKPEFSDMQGMFKGPGEFPENKFTFHWAIVVFFMQFFGQVQLSSAGRYLSVKDGKEGTKAAWWAFTLMTIGSAVWFIPPMVARFLYESDVMALDMNDPATGAYAVIAMKVLPNGLMGIMIAAMFAATMSSMDSGINGQTGVIVNNLLGRIREVMHLKPLPDRFLVRLCRIISTCLGIIVICFSLLLATQDEIELFDVFLLMASLIGMPMVMPLLAGIIFRRLPSWSYFLIMCSAMLPSLYSFLVVELWDMEPWTIQERGGWVMLFGIIATAISIPLARFSTKRHKERERKFFEQMITPVDFKSEVGESNDAAQANLIGKVIILLACLLSLLLLVPNPMSGRLVILGLVVPVATIGGILLWSSKKP